MTGLGDTFDTEVAMKYSKVTWGLLLCKPGNLVILQLKRTLGKESLFKKLKYS